METQAAGEMVTTSSVTLVNNNILENSDLVFTNDVLGQSEDGATYITVPFHFLQNQAIPETNTIQDNFYLKNVGGNTILIDSSQYALLTGESSQYILNSADLSEEQTNQIVLSDEILPKDKAQRSEILSEMGIGIDLNTLGTTDDILAVQIEGGSRIQSSGNTNVTLNLASVISSRLSHVLAPESRFKRGPGRPRREEVEVDPPIGKGPYCCETCGKEFVKWSQMKKHTKLHSDDKPFACLKCSASFNVESNLTLHMVTHDADNLTCPECKKKFSRVASLKAHIMLHEKEESLFCPECGEEFSTQAQLDSHFKEHQEEDTKIPLPKINNCRHCHQFFMRASQLREHMKDHYKVKASLSHKSHKRNIDRSTFVHKCDTCTKCFQKPSQLVRHRRIHTGERPYKCDLCTRAFSQKGSLQIHMSKHNGIKPFHCDFCAAAFSQKGNLRAHILRVHTIPHPGEQVYKCSECTCVFKKLGSLNAHMSRMHYTADGQKVPSVHPSRSAFVGVNFDSIMTNLPSGEHETRSVELDSDILQQALVNSGLSGKSQESNSDPSRENPNITRNGDTSLAVLSSNSISANSVDGQCEGSPKLSKGKSSTTFVALAEKALDGSVRRYCIRQRRVGNIRWHQCSYCIKEFKKPSDLVRHIRTHTHERPYKCTHCFRSFAVKSALTAHIRTHTGVKDYPCATCNKKFSSASSLKVHQRLHTGVRQFPCTHCNKAFRTSGQRKAHVLSHLRDEDMEAKRRQRANKIDLSNLPHVTLQEPIIITENGLVQSNVPPNGQIYLTDEASAAERPHKCGVCNAGFRKADHLKQHMKRIHTGERPFKCEQCNKCFFSNAILKAHIRTHDGIKMHMCDVCNNLFSTQRSLKRHAATHSDQRTVLCPYCHKTFKTKINCRKHMRIHRQELAIQAAQQKSKELANGPGVGLNTSFTSTLPDYPQGFPNQTFSLPRIQQDQIGTDFVQSTTMVQSLTGDLSGSTDLHSVQDVITHTLNADGTGTITLPAVQHTLTQENINEIKRTLNAQLFSASEDPLGSSNDNAATLGITTSGSTPVPNEESAHCNNLHSNSGNMLPDHASDLESTTTDDLSRTFTAAAVQSTQAQQSVIPEFVLCEAQSGNKTSKSDTNGLFAASFGTQSFDNCVFSSVSLQTGLESLAQNTAITSNITPLIPPSNDNATEASLSEAVNGDLEGGATIRLTTGEIISKISGSELISDGQEMNENEESVQVNGTTTDGSQEEGVHQFEEIANEQADGIVVSVVRGRGRGRGSRRPFKCEVCKQSFKRTCHLKSHMRSHNGDKSYICTFCNVKCGSASALKAHLKLHAGEKDFLCPVCQSRFTTNDTLTCHMAIHSDVRPFKCSVCFAQFRTDTSFSQVRKHIRLHELGEKKDVIENRGRRRATVIQLTPEETQVLAQQSIDSASTVSEKVLISSAAEKDRISELKDPEDQYRNEPLFPNQCKYCPKSFRKPSDLVRHVRIHTGERPFQCSCCNKCFTVKSTLDSHMKTHSGQKLCTCHVCSRLYATKGSLKVHMRLHTGAKPFKCPKCDMRFRTSGHRKAHLLSHMKEIISNKSSHSHGMKSGSRRRKLLSAALSQESAADSGSALQVAESQLNSISQITLDATTLGNLLPLSSSEPLNAGSLLTNNSDNNTVVNNLQFQIADGFQITGIDSSGTLLTQSLQLDENLLQQLQHTSNIIIQTSVPDITENASDNVENNSSLGTIPPIQYEVHTDESGHIIISTPTTTDQVNSGDIIFNVGGDLGLHVISNPESTLALTEQPTPSKYRVTDSLKGGRSLIALNECLEKKDESEGEVVMEDDFLVFHDCEVCGKRFSKPSQLQRHTRIHTGERPFECHLCLKRFNQKNALNTHIKSHTGERPYPCPHCDYSFTQKGNLKTHLRRAHRFSSYELVKPNSPSKSVLKIKQPTLTVCNSEMGNALEQVVCDLFPQVKNTSDSESVNKLC